MPLTHDLLLPEFNSRSLSVVLGYGLPNYMHLRFATDRMLSIVSLGFLA